ncbi:MAG: hypothetical protein AB1918_13755 [Pseudomonadota bacterium]
MSVPALMNDVLAPEDEVERQCALLDITPELVAGKTVLPAGTGMYYPECRHLLSDEEIRAWFRDVGITEVHRGRRQFIGIRT